MTLRWLALAALVTCGGCALMKEGIHDTAAEAEEDDESFEESPGIRCRLEAPTGSNLRRKVCYASQPSTLHEKDVVESTLGQRGTNVPPVSGSPR